MLGTVRFEQSIRRVFGGLMGSAGFAPALPVREWYWFGVEYVRWRVSVLVVCNMEFGGVVEVDLRRPDVCFRVNGGARELPWGDRNGSGPVLLEVICEGRGEADVAGATGKVVALDDEGSLTAHLEGLARALRVVMGEIIAMDDAEGPGRFISGMCYGESHVAYCVSASDEPSFYVLLDVGGEGRAREVRFVRLEELRAKWEKVERGELRLESVAEVSRSWRAGAEQGRR